MTRVLLVLRHAKSSWDEPGLADHDRPLAPRGASAAAAMNAHFRARGLAPDLSLCSTARRAQETLASLGLAVAPLLESGLYHASEGELLARLQRIDDAHACVLLVGHNPGLEALVRALVGVAKPRAARRLAKGLKTGALAELELPIERWQELKLGIGNLTRLTRPKDLRD